MGPRSRCAELGPGDKYRNLKKLNESCPRSEWRKIRTKRASCVAPGNISTCSSWSIPFSMDDYSFPTSTTGGALAISALCNSIERMRQFRGDGVYYPVVQLSHCYMHTQYSGRERPHFIIKTWLQPGGAGGDGPKVVSGGPAPAAQLPHTVASAIEGTPTVSEPTLREETADLIPF